MDTLIAQASESLAKASMNRRGFLGKLAGAAGGATVLAGLLAQAAKANNCDWSHPHCVESCGKVWSGTCGAPCDYDERNLRQTCRMVDCYTGDFCRYETFHRGCTDCHE